MNNAKTSNYGKIIAFFLIASILLGTFGFAAEGWQSSLPDDSSAEHEKDDTDGVQDGLLGQAPSEPEPVYYNPLTGLATTIEASVIRPLGFVISTDAPFYGISDTEILRSLIQRQCVLHPPGQLLLLCHCHLGHLHKLVRNVSFYWCKEGKEALDQFNNKIICKSIREFYNFHIMLIETFL